MPPIESGSFVNRAPVILDPWGRQGCFQQSTLVTLDGLVRQGITVEYQNSHVDWFLWFPNQVERKSWSTTTFETAHPFFRPEFQVVTQRVTDVLLLNPKILERPCFILSKVRINVLMFFGD